MLRLPDCAPSLYAKAISVAIESCQTSADENASIPKI